MLYLSNLISDLPLGTARETTLQTTTGSTYAVKPRAITPQKIWASTWRKREFIAIRTISISFWTVTPFQRVAYGRRQLVEENPSIRSRSLLML